MKSHMRYGNAAAHAGRSEPLALEQFGQDQGRQHVDDHCGPPRQLFQEFLFVGEGDVGDHVRRRQEV